MKQDLWGLYAHAEGANPRVWAERDQQPAHSRPFRLPPGCGG